MYRKPSATLEDLLARAALFRTLALGFSYPDSNQGVTLRKALNRLTTPLPYPITGPIHRALRLAQRASHTILGTGLEGEYVRLFLGSTICSLHETTYDDGRRLAGQTRELADISGFYRAFGLTIAEGQPDLPDHLCSELEFLSLCLVKLGYAQSRPVAARAEGIIATAITAFLHDHLGRWVPVFAAKLQRETSLPHFRTLATLLQHTVAAECRLWRVRPLLISGAITRDGLVQGDELICPHHKS
ncbi:putative dimethyl sulfoxide reductase chaperone [Gammaproteobacteria bacterium]